MKTQHQWSPGDKALVKIAGKQCPAVITGLTDDNKAMLRIAVWTLANKWSVSRYPAPVQLAKLVGRDKCIAGLDD